VNVRFECHRGGRAGARPRLARALVLLAAACPLMLYATTAVAAARPAHGRQQRRVKREPGVLVLRREPGVLELRRGSGVPVLKRDPGVLELRRDLGELRRGPGVLRRGLDGPRPRARAAIVGGGHIAVAQAPWQVEVESFIPAEGIVLECGGSILDATHILTAAHCLFNPQTRAPIEPEHIFVIAGTSDIDATDVEEPTQQVTRAARVRVHPYFDYAAEPEAPDDVAVLELTTPLTLSAAAGTTASAIGLAAAGSTLAEGAQVRLAGFGRQDAGEEPDGLLYSLGMSVAYSRQCGGEADALYVCADAASGSACEGDSGGGLIDPGATSTLVGVVDTVEVLSGESCGDGALAAFANVAAPEIGDFIAGSEAPPRAPQGGGAVIRGVPKVGYSLTCEPGTWSNAPMFTYAFVDGAGAGVLQRGAASTYALSAADVGRTIYCEVQAANAGGTGVGRTPSLRAIEAAAPAPPSSLQAPPQAPAPAVEAGGISLRGGSLAVRGGAVSVTLSCSGGAECRGKLTLTARGRSKRGHRTHAATIGTAGFSIGGGRTITLQVELDATGLELLAKTHGRLASQLAILQLAPGPGLSRTESVQLLARKATRRRSRRRRR
jgi:hypothetical protein